MTRDSDRTLSLEERTALAEGVADTLKDSDLAAVTPFQPARRPWVYGFRIVVEEDFGG